MNVFGGQQMFNYRLLIVILIIALFNLNLANASSVIGKVIVKSNTEGRSDLYPLLSSHKTTFGNDALIKFIGGILVVEKGTSLEAKEDNNNINFYIGSGNINFRIDSSKAVVGFYTPNGTVMTEHITKSSLNNVEGRIEINDNGTSLVKLQDGSLVSIAEDGSTTRIRGGQAIILSESKIVAQGDIETNGPGEVDTESTDTGVQTDETLVAVESATQLPAGLIELLNLVGAEAYAKTTIYPTGEIGFKEDEQFDGKAKLVDYAIQPTDKTIVIKDDPVKVICVSLDENQKKEYLVRPYDNLYPELPQEKNLVDRTVIVQGLLNPEGNSRFEVEEQGRSASNWNTVVVDPKTMQPDNTANVPDGAKLEVICVRTTLILQPKDIVNENYVNLIGNEAVAKTSMSPTGLVVVNGVDYPDAIAVDLNLQPIKNVEFVSGSRFTVVGAKPDENDPLSTILLVQQQGIVPEELQFAVGENALAKADFSKYGVFDVKGKEWWGVVVDKQLVPNSTYSAGTQFAIVGVTTSLLAAPAPLLLAYWGGTSILPLIFAGGVAASVPAIAIPLAVSITDNPASSSITPPPSL